MPYPVGKNHASKAKFWAERRESVIEEVSFLIDQGERMPRLAERVGLKPDSLRRNIQRWNSQGFTDLVLP